MTIPMLWRRGCAAILFFVSCALTADATTLLKTQRLPELVAGSERAVLVRVVAVGYGYDEHRLPTTRVTLAVEETLYGEDLPAVGESFEIKLFGAPETMPDGMRFFLQGTPRYQPGDRYVLLLMGESEWGFTNTAGLLFGAFRVEDDDAGNPVARSMAGNRLAFGDEGIAAWLPGGSAERNLAPADPGAPVPYPVLRSAIVGLRQTP